MLDFLREEGIDGNLISEVEQYRKFYKLNPDMKYRIPNPKYNYYGKDIWEEAITALLCGENLLLVGPKATGKNVLAENLAAAFGRPRWDISFHGFRFPGGYGRLWLYLWSCSWRHYGIRFIFRQD